MRFTFCTNTQYQICSYLKIHVVPEQRFGVVVCLSFVLLFCPPLPHSCFFLSSLVVQCFFDDKSCFMVLITCLCSVLENRPVVGKCHVLFHLPCIKNELTGRNAPTVNMQPEGNAESLKSFHRGSEFSFVPEGKKHNMMMMMMMHIYEY